ncbi:MAG: Npt1/Npt2 family nucleotide transporter [Parachlamydiales bacterium]
MAILTLTSHLRTLLSKCRQALLPVERHELIRVIPMGLLIFALAFNYYVLRCVKDSMLTTAAHSGTEALPFAKIWVLIPMAFLLSAIFYKLSHRLNAVHLFSSIVGGFLAFFLLFALVIYPLGDTLHLHTIADWLEGRLPKGFVGMIAVIRYWSYALFYVMAELWGSMCMTVLFWGYASEVTKLDEAKRFYSLFAIAANLAGVVAGPCSTCFARSGACWIGDSFYTSLLMTLGSVLIMGLASIVIFSWLHNRVMSPRMEVTSQGIDKKLSKIRTKASFWGSFAQLRRSRYLLSIATVAIGYSVVSYLVEVVWKEQVRLTYPEKTLYNAYFGQVTFGIGIVSTIMAVFTSLAIRKFGWTRVAVITPTLLLLTSIGFFGLQFLPGGWTTTMGGLFGMSAANFILFFGSAQNVLSRSCKYTVFDATKEMCYIPLTKAARTQGKAAIDGVGSRLGKSGGAAVYQALFIISGRTITGLIPWVSGVLGLIFAGWILAVRQLGRSFAKIEAQQAAGPEEGLEPAAQAAS